MRRGQDSNLHGLTPIKRAVGNGAVNPVKRTVTSNHSTN
jgi:hypothetical protein